MFALPARIWMYTYGNDFRSLYALLISKAHKTQATATEDVAVGCPFGFCQSLLPLMPNNPKYLVLKISRG